VLLHPYAKLTRMRVRTIGARLVFLTGMLLVTLYFARARAANAKSCSTSPSQLPCAAPRVLIDLSARLGMYFARRNAGNLSGDRDRGSRPRGQGGVSDALMGFVSYKFPERFFSSDYVSGYFRDLPHGFFERQ